MDGRAGLPTTATPFRAVKFPGYSSCAPQGRCRSGSSGDGMRLRERSGIWGPVGKFVGIAGAGSRCRHSGQLLTNNWD